MRQSLAFEMNANELGKAGKRDAAAAKKAHGQKRKTDTNVRATESQIGSDQPIGQRAKLVLVVLLKNKAFDSDHLMAKPKIATALSKLKKQNVDPRQYGHVITELKSKQLVQTREGQSGGCWLTKAGRKRAEKLPKTT